MKIKLIALDLDGTTLRSDGTLSNRSRLAIREAAQKGAIIVPATGRVLVELPECLTNLPEIRYVITSNGACVYDKKENRVLHAEYIPISAVKKVWTLLSHYNDVLIECYRDGGSFLSRSDLEQLDTFHLTPSVQRFLTNSSKPVENLYEYLCVLRDPKIEKFNIRAADASILQELWQKLSTLGEIDVTSAGYNCVEINRKGVNKACGLIALCEHIAVGSQNVMAIGDGLNDKEMLAFSGLPVAMKNAVSEIIQIGDFVTESNDRDGAALAIEKFVLGLEP